MGRIAYTLEMMKSSWQVLKQEKGLLLFPLISGACCLVVLASFAVPLWATGHFQNTAKVNQNPGLYYGLLFAFYFVNYFIVIFFNTALVACAIQRMRGGEPTLSAGLNAAASRLHQILGWALVSATVGLILRILEDRSSRAMEIIASLLGMAWSMMTFFVVPILVVENKGPIAAVAESASLFKKTWGEQFVGAFGFGLVFFLLSLVGAIPIILGVMAFAAAPPLGVLLIAVGVIYVILVGLVQSALQTIFQAALYLYAREGRAPQGFDESDLSAAMTPRQTNE